MHRLKAFREILASMIVESEVGVAIGNCWAVIAEHLLLDYDALSQELDCLEVVSDSKLNVCHL